MNNKNTPERFFTTLFFPWAIGFKTLDRFAPCEDFSTRAISLRDTFTPIQYTLHHINFTFDLSTPVV